MDIEQTKKAIEVMQAFVDGKTVQFMDPDGWEDTLYPTWDWFHYAYRIKPEPKEIWVNEYKGGRHDAFDNENDAESSGYSRAIRKAVRYREVIE